MFASKPPAWTTHGVWGIVGTLQLAFFMIAPLLVLVAGFSILAAVLALCFWPPGGYLAYRALKCKELPQIVAGPSFTVPGMNASRKR